MNITKRYTIKQVARAAGVSSQTVSRVINDQRDVSDETRAHIQQLIRKLGYHPSALARSLIRRRSDTLGVVTAGLRFNGPSRTLNGITSRVDELGYALLLKELPRFDSGHIDPLLQTLLAWRVDGIIWAAPEVGDNRAWLEQGLATIHVPIVFLNMESRPGLSIVNYDNFQGARQATRHLLDQGYRRIGHISGPLDWWESRQRRAGWQQALAEAGIEVQDAHTVAGDWSASSVEAALPRLQRQYPGMDAVFTGNDQMALGVIKLAGKQGLTVPDALGVVGFDGLAEAAYYWPALTTISQDQYLLGCTAVEQVMQAIEYLREEGAPPTPQTVVLQPELVVRSSSLRLTAE
jgi:LacI family transcriptional regulator